MGFFEIDRISKKDFSRLDKLFEQFIPTHKEIYLFGAGEIGKAIYWYLRNCGIQPTGFIQSSAFGGEIEGIPILSLPAFEAQFSQGNGQGIILSLDDKFYGEVLKKLLFVGEENLFFLGQEKVHTRTHIRDIQTCSFQIVDHCNLACFACNVGAPVAEKGFMSLETFSRDVRLLRNAVGRRLERLGLTGGEAILHPQLKSFMRVAREVFPETRIQLLTNGLLLHKQDESFWETMRENQIEILMTKYPVSYPNFEDVMKLTNRYCITIQVSNAEIGKDSCYLPLNEAGSEKIYDFGLCGLFNFPRVIDGRLYPCCLMPEVHHLNQRFGTNIPLVEEDSLDLAAVEDYEQVKSFLLKRPPLCSYCSIRSRKSMGWKPSTRTKEEWFVSGNM